MTKYSMQTSVILPCLLIICGLSHSLVAHSQQPSKHALASSDEDSLRSLGTPSAYALIPVLKVKPHTRLNSRQIALRLDGKVVDATAMPYQELRDLAACREGLGKPYVVVIDLIGDYQQRLYAAQERQYALSQLDHSIRKLSKTGDLGISMSMLDPATGKQTAFSSRKDTVLKSIKLLEDDASASVCVWQCDTPEGWISRVAAARSAIARLRTVPGPRAVLLLFGDVPGIGPQDLEAEIRSAAARVFIVNTSGAIGFNGGIYDYMADITRPEGGLVAADFNDVWKAFPQLEADSEVLKVKLRTQPKAPMSVELVGGERSTSLAGSPFLMDEVK